MPLLVWILLFSLLGSVLSLLAASVFLTLPDRLHDRVLPHFVSFAIGALLGAAFLALLPHALASPSIGDLHHLTGAVLAGLLGFFLLEKMVLWRHCHSHECEAHAPDPDNYERGRKQSLISMILVGDGLHNFVDGVLIAAAFLTDIELGIVTSIAVAAHEIPQEVGDFALLLHGGLSRARALTFNLLSSLTTLVGAILAYVGLSQVEAVVPYVLAVAAASFIYIAVADLIPSLHHRTQLRATLQQIGLIVLGVAVIATTHAWMH